MAFGDEEHQHHALADALGPENTAGFHMEIFYQSSLFWDLPRRGDGTRFPCIDANNDYSGCLGSDCCAAACWTGELVPSARNAASPRVPLPQVERKGALCHMCAHATDQDDGLVDCDAGHFDRPITPACLLRRRVPETVSIPCPDHVPGSQLRPDVVAFRHAKRASGSRK